MCADNARFFDQLEKMKKFKNDLFDNTFFVIGVCLNNIKFVRKMRLGKDINLDEKANIASNVRGQCSIL